MAMELHRGSTRSSESTQQEQQSLWPPTGNAAEAELSQQAQHLKLTESTAVPHQPRTSQLHANFTTPDIAVQGVVPQQPVLDFAPGVNLPARPSLLRVTSFAERPLAGTPEDHNAQEVPTRSLQDADVEGACQQPLAQRQRVQSPQHPVVIPGQHSSSERHSSVKEQQIASTPIDNSAHEDAARSSQHTGDQQPSQQQRSAVMQAEEHFQPPMVGSLQASPSRLPTSMGQQLAGLHRDAGDPDGLVHPNRGKSGSQMVTAPMSVGTASTPAQAPMQPVRRPRASGHRIFLQGDSLGLDESSDASPEEAGPVPAGQPPTHKQLAKQPGRSSGASRFKLFLQGELAGMEESSDESPDQSQDESPERPRLLADAQHCPPAVGLERTSIPTDNAADAIQERMRRLQGVTKAASLARVPDRLAHASCQVQPRQLISKPQAFMYVYFPNQANVPE